MVSPTTGPPMETVPVAVAPCPACIEVGLTESADRPVRLTVNIFVSPPDGASLKVIDLVKRPETRLVETVNGTVLVPAKMTTVAGTVIEPDPLVR